MATACLYAESPEPNSTTFWRLQHKLEQAQGILSHLQEAWFAKSQLSLLLKPQHIWIVIDSSLQTFWDGQHPWPSSGDAGSEDLARGLQQHF